MPNELMRLQADDGSAVLIEIDAPDPSVGEVVFDGAVHQAKESLEQALADVRAIAVKALDTLRSGTQSPDNVELEFGVKFRAESGAAVLARSAAEGTIVVRMSWAAPRGGPAGRPALYDDDYAEDV